MRKIKQVCMQKAWLYWSGKRHYGIWKHYHSTSKGVKEHKLL